jgi:endonuclease YncB( thermonuclease family)
MRKIMAMLVVLVALLTITAYAAAKSYQFTGVVKTVQGDTFTVQKSPTETWEFSKDATTKGTVKVGDKVTVHYRMIATDIEASAAPAKPKK